jgi:acetyl esterase/lipase
MRQTLSEKSRREFLRDTLTSGIALGISPSLLSAQRTSTTPLKTDAPVDPYAVVDPELVPALKALPKLILNSQTLPMVRQEPVPPPLPAPAPQPVERRIPGPAGAPELRLIIVDPAPGEKGRPALLHTHGGGYVARSAALAIHFLQTVAQTCNCIVVSVEYRLAPETPFPGSLEDNYTALRWLYPNADALGVDRKRIGVGSQSDGARVELTPVPSR